MQKTARNMIEEVGDRIEEWATYILSEDSCSLSMLAKIQIMGPAGACIRGEFNDINKPMPRRIAEVENAIFAMPVKVWIDIVLLNYISDKNQQDAASSLGISLGHYKRTLRDAHIFIAPLLGISSPDL